ncbi:MAG: SDR family oxidoreductase [Caldilineaceae bacterium]|nr:SDR family oxidoreductase [Caldilineaceae bacterium]
MKFPKMLTLGVIAGAAGAAAVNNRTRPRRAFLPLRPGATASALVTGASAGLGAEFARQLAAGGYRVTLAARRGDRLEALQQELLDRYGMESDILVADLSTDAGIDKAAQHIRAMDDLTVLVNNAGFGTVGRLVNTDPVRQQEMVHLHVLAVMSLSQAALPGMTARGGGAIINVSSVAAFSRMPGNVNYCATKAYINAFSQTLAAELMGTGVRVQALCPGYIVTEFHDTSEYTRFNRDRSPGFLWLKASDVARASLDALGGSRVIVVPGTVYKAAVMLLRTPGIGPMANRAAKKLR